MGSFRGQLGLSVPFALSLAFVVAIFVFAFVFFACGIIVVVRFCGFADPGLGRRRGFCARGCRWFAR